ncbi:hypothetical protein [Bradyrhizobium sp. CCGUVB23]|nr:hypothetical protein [Bradyrhizobium sp. CCGUVB23]
MIWLIALVVPLVGAPLFVSAYGRRLGALTGPWIAKEGIRDD